MEDIQSNVTYKVEDRVVRGPKSKKSNQMTLPEYEVMSNMTRSVGVRPIGSALGENVS